MKSSLKRWGMFHVCITLSKFNKSIESDQWICRPLPSESFIDSEFYCLGKELLKELRNYLMVSWQLVCVKTTCKQATTSWMLYNALYIYSKNNLREKCVFIFVSVASIVSCNFCHSRDGTLYSSKIFVNCIVDRDLWQPLCRVSKNLQTVALLIGFLTL